MNIKEKILEAGYHQLFTEPDSNSRLEPQMRGGKHQLNQHLDARGGLVELWRQSWELRWDHPNASDDLLKSIEELGDSGRRAVRQVYISSTMPGVVKAWHCHEIQVDRFVCIAGRILLVTLNLYLEGAEIVERVLDYRKPELVVVPPGTAHGWMALGNEEAMVLNMVSHEYLGTDEYRSDPCIPAKWLPSYNWRRNRDG